MQNDSCAYYCPFWVLGGNFKAPFVKLGATNFSRIFAATENKIVTTFRDQTK